MLDQLGMYQVKDMNTYIEPLIAELSKLWDGVAMYDISRPIGQRHFNSMEYLDGQFMMPPG